MVLRNIVLVPGEKKKKDSLVDYIVVCYTTDLKLLGRLILVFDPQKSLTAVKIGRRNYMALLNCRISNNSKLVLFFIFSVLSVSVNKIICFL